MLALLALLAQPAQASRGGVKSEFSLPSPAAVAREVAGCGLDPKRFAVQRDETLEEDVVQVHPGARPLSTDRITCLARVSIKTTYDIYFDDKAVRAEYEPIASALTNEHDRLDARKWLDTHGKLASLPPYDPKVDNLELFAKRLETFCGIAPGSVLRAVGEDMITLRSYSLDSLDQHPIPNEAVECLTRGASARGVMFGFVGNAALPTPDKFNAGQPTASTPSNSPRRPNGRRFPR